MIWAEPLVTTLFSPSRGLERLIRFGKMPDQAVHDGRPGMTRGRAGREAGREGKPDTTGEFDRGGEEAVTNVKGVPRGTVRRR